MKFSTCSKLCSPVERLLLSAFARGLRPPCETIRAQASAAEVQGVISAVGRRTITFQTERKGKVCEEVDDRTKAEKEGANVNLGDLQESDLALINDEPEGTRRRLRSG